ncbi:MAG TPA: class I SAM-dependent methyltransferase [Chloroflexota bacterium]|nr:class I SAM-dependent methyltransferase [Chloroflexota bacterium]
MHTDTILSEFTRQSSAFNAAPVMRSAETLQTVVDSVPVGANGGAWAEIACGPGLVSRALSPRLRRIVGIDLTQGMLTVGRSATTQAGITNVAFVQGDAIRLPVADGALDGAVTRFSLHHIPVPGRCVAEMARAVRPGGLVIVADHVTTTDVDGAAWHQEIERLRDPSHWTCLSTAALRATGERARLVLQTERTIPFSLEYEEWLTRGTGGEQARGLIDQLLRDRPAGADSFRVIAGAGGERTLHLSFWLSVWQRPAGG